MLAAAGDLDEALSWAAEHHLSVHDELSYMHEYEHITLARVLLARYRAQRLEPTLRDVSRLLERLLSAAEQGERTGSLIEILVLQALVHYARGDVIAAVSALEHAARLADPEGYVRIFAEHGPPMVALLRLLTDRHPMWAYVRTLLAAAAAPEPAVAAPPMSAPSVSLAPAPPVPETVSGGVVDPLSERELQVLRLLATDLDGPDVARRLVVSLNTLRTHTRNIYAKLGVNNRRAAVRRAGELNLL
jgi:LuxR family maltose regulon positive regulatory protein